MAKVKKSFEEINERIRSGKAVVLTADEMSDLVDEVGPAKAAREVDVVTTGTFGMMCSSGAMFNFGHTTPKIKSAQVWFNDVPTYAGLAAVDAYLGATEPKEDDPLNRVYPGRFLYGGAHVIEDLVAGKAINVRVKAYGTDCYPAKNVEMEKTLEQMPYAVLLNPRNAYQNYNCAVNLGERTIYTYMGVLKPDGGNANYCSAGQLSPLLNDPLYRTIGLGTRIFLGGNEGFVIWHGTQHNPNARRSDNGVVRSPAGTIAVLGDLKGMKHRYLRGASMLGYGISLFIGLGIPIPILDEEMARYTGVRDKDIHTNIVDYAVDYPQSTGKIIGEVSYEELRSGTIRFNGREIPTSPLSSYPLAVEVATELKRWILEEGFTLGVPQHPLPGPRS
ncbi:MAG: homocysteine biosynthesis protein [bacterium]|nr:MAG: homocysteine biosynthesis protein [bacterium]